MNLCECTGVRSVTSIGVAVCLPFHLDFSFLSFRLFFILFLFGFSSFFSHFLLNIY